MSMRIHLCGPLYRFCLLCVCSLASGVGSFSAHAFQVADGMALLRQEMPANYCALTFDDGPGPYTASLLDLLAKRDIVATFFVVGKNAERRPALIARMLAEGHEVASHSYSHADMRRLKPDAQALEMQKTLDAVQSMGAQVRYFRPPYGRYTPETVAQAETLGMTIMLWSLDSQDWKRRVSRLEGLRSVSPAEQLAFSGLRGVFLFHDTHKHTVDEMADILDALLVGGCERFVTVSDYMARAPREEEHRLSTQIPDRRSAELSPSTFVVPLSAGFDGALAPPKRTRDQWMYDAGMRTQAAHTVDVRSGGTLRTQAAHGAFGSPMPDAPDTLATGIVTHEQSAATQGRSPRPLVDPGLFPPARKSIKNKQDDKHGEGNPG